MKKKWSFREYKKTCWHHWPFSITVLAPTLVMSANCFLVFFFSGYQLWDCLVNSLISSGIVSRRFWSLWYAGKHEIICTQLLDFEFACNRHHFILRNNKHTNLLLTEFTNGDCSERVPLMTFPAMWLCGQSVLSLNVKAKKATSVELSRC